MVFWVQLLCSVIRWRTKSFREAEKYHLESQLLPSSLTFIFRLTPWTDIISNDKNRWTIKIRLKKENIARGTTDPGY